eukprot:scaffold42879_cov32-Tisochrysis_lutea.AAC.1
MAPASPRSPLVDGCSLSRAVSPLCWRRSRGALGLFTFTSQIHLLLITSVVYVSKVQLRKENKTTLDG